VDIHLNPVAVNENGKVLMKSLIRHGFYPGLDLGFLVVSSKGVWGETVYAHHEFEEKDLNVTSRIAEDEFRKNLDWTNIPTKAKAFLGKWKFSSRDSVSPGLGGGELTWSAKEIRKSKTLITGPIRQRTPWNNLSAGQGEQGDPIRCVVYFAGLALFRNVDSAHATETHVDNPRFEGARFDISSACFPIEGEVRSWDPDRKDEKENLSGCFKDIDGICIVPEK
jgi:hypothetical protein